MKCVILKSNNKVVRMSDASAYKMVAEGSAFYCDKSLWKETGRNYMKEKK